MKYIIDTDKLPCNNGKNCTTCPFWSIDDTCEIKEQVKKLPKYEERPNGEWIMHKNFDGHLRFYECSNCGNTQGYLSNFCEVCGSNNKEK